MNRQRDRRRAESGFAMLLVFVMAATIAITLFIEVPRIAFESQRTREQMAIDRALQYQRGIQLFYRKYRLYPQTLDDLETTRNIRFLRRRYKDPLTGKEYRLLHVGPSGQLTDSLIQPPAPLPGSSTGSGPTSSPGSPPTSGSAQTSGTSASNSAQPVDPNNPNAQAPDPLNMALRRPSDRITPTAAGAANGGQPGEPDPNLPPDQPQPPQPLDPSQSGQPFVPGQSGQPTYPPSQPGQPLSPAQPGFPFPGQQPFPSATGPGAATAGAAGPAGNNQAANMIQQLLTTPRQPPTTSPFTTGNTGGIAGVASTAEGKGIHVVNNHAKYKEWEFVYDIKKDATAVGAGGVAQQQQIQQQMQQGQQPNGALGTSTGTTTGNSPFSSSPTSTSTSPSAAPAAPTTPPPQ